MSNIAPDQIKQDWQFDADLLQRYDRPGPRYTSYPTAPHFHDGFGQPEFADVVKRSNEKAGSHPLSLYVHVPYCWSPCFYCGCNRVITRDLSKGNIYLAQLQREIAMIAPMFDKKREVIQLHLGGGTPNFLSTELLAELVNSLRQAFNFSTNIQPEISIELDPRFVKPDEIGKLAEIGFNRASLGVQDFDPEVQQAINRIQTVEETLAIIDACRQYGMQSVNVDLIYGLPKQNIAGFTQTLDTVIAVRPDRLAIYGYAHLPQLFKAQKQLQEEYLPTPEVRLALLGLAVKKLSAAGYRYIGMDHFALPEDELSQAQQHGGLHRNFMGYTTHADTDLVGFGVSAISHIGNTFSQNYRDLPEWEHAISEDRQPIWRGLLLNDDDVLRADLIQKLMCQGTIDIAQLERDYHIDFASYFKEELIALKALQEDDLITQVDGGFQTTVRGRPLLRLAAMCFDHYLKKPQQNASYSKAI